MICCEFIEADIAHQSLHFGQTRLNPRFFSQTSPMPNFIEVLEAADQLTLEDQAGLIAHLLAGLSLAPLGADDVEAQRRDDEMDSGVVVPLTHDEFLSALGRR